MSSFYCAFFEINKQTNVLVLFKNTLSRVANFSRRSMTDKQASLTVGFPNMFTIKLMVGRRRVLIVVLGGTALNSWYIAQTGVYSADIARSHSNCLAWRIPSSEKSVRDWRYTVFSTPMSEKSDSIDAVLGNMDARPPENCHKLSNRP